MTKTISAVVLTKNEEKNIVRCLKSLLWCDEIIIVDDNSEDETLSVISSRLSAIRNKIKIYKRNTDRDFSAQRNFGLEKANGEWVFFVDADEVISDELRKEIISVCHPESCHAEFISASSKIRKQVQHDTVGYYIRRKDYFLGKWLKYGETGKIKFIRLVRKDAGKWIGKVHEKWIINGKLGEFYNPILHYPHPTISSFLININNYTDILTEKWHQEGKKMKFWEILFFPIGKFLQNYILRLGFMDGVPGLIMATMMSFHSFLARGKFYLRYKNA